MCWAILRSADCQDEDHEGPFIFVKMERSFCRGMFNFTLDEYVSFLQTEINLTVVLACVLTVTD